MKSVGNKKHFEVNDELIQKLDKGEVSFADLDAETEAAVGDYLTKLDEAAPGETPAAQPAAEEKVETKQEGEPAAKPPKGYVEGTRFKEVADKASDFENKWKADQKRLRELEDKLKAKEAEPITAPSLDHVWSDQGQQDLHKTVLELKRKQETFESEQKRTLEEARAERLAAKNETELLMLRSNPLSKDIVPEGTLEDMEKAYTAFYYATGATAEDASNVKKYFEDPVFRKDMEAKGVKPPKDFEKINTILQVKALRDKFAAVDPDFKMSDAYVHYMAKSNKLSAAFVEERLKGAAQVADKLHANANETITMQPGSTSGATQDSWSDAQMMDWMNKHPHPKTKEEKATFARICSILDERAEQAANF